MNSENLYWERGDYAHHKFLLKGLLLLKHARVLPRLHDLAIGVPGSGLMSLSGTNANVARALLLQNALAS
jgi:hypothetical protein